MAVNWTEKVSAFSRAPSRFLCATTAECFLAELLRELRDDIVPDTVKVLLLSPLCEHASVLCPSECEGEETALELMSILAQCPPKSVPLRRHLLLALTSVLVCSSCVSARSPGALDLLELLLQMAQDTGDLQAEGSVRATACDCLRELEACCPGLLTHRLELLGGLRQREASRLHQAYAGLHTLVLRNAVYHLTQQTGGGAQHLKALLGGDTSVAWEAEQEQEDPGPVKVTEPGQLCSLLLGPMGSAPTLHTGPDCKELRTVLSSLLEESYLLTPLCQAALLHRLIEVVAMVPAVPPAVFRAQLLRLLGTCQVSLFHSTVLMKAAFTDSLFSAEDEAFMLRRLVVLSQHPLLCSPEKLFFVDCILHFPENRPIGGDESLPVLLTSRLASALMPTVFNDSHTALARLHLLALVYQEEGEDPASLYTHLSSLRHMVEYGGTRDMVVTFFRAALLFLLYFSQAERCADALLDALCGLYLGHTYLAPHLINLADRTQDRIPECSWAVRLLRALQGVITEAPLARLTLQDLSWHVKVLSRVAEETEISQRSTVSFLSRVMSPSSSSLSVSGDWRLGNSLLSVCRRLLVHPGLDALLVPLADVLQHLACHYGDVDVQDHARLYYSLLTTLSGDKMATVLAQGLHEPGGGQVKRRTLSSVVAESEGQTSVLTVHQTDSAVLRLTEARQEAACGVESDESQQQLHSVPLALQLYRDQFEQPDFASEIAFHYQLSHTNTKDSRFDQLFSIRLHFTLTDLNYQQLSDVSVPCVFRDRPGPAVILRLKPRHPYPTTLQASALFTTADGLTWLSVMPDIPVAFRQVLVVPPVPPAWGRGHALSLFQGLWDEMKREDGACSLFCCQMKEAAMTALVHRHFQPFIVSRPSDSDEFKVLLFLPPRSHLLLRIRSEEDTVHFDMSTDHWQLLPHITSYLRTITSSQEHTHS